MTLAAVDRVLCSRPRWQVVVSALVLAGLIGVADHFTGFEISFAVFYLLPIVLAAWYAGEVTGVVLCGVCSAIWLLVDFTAGSRYSQAWMPWWNAGSRFVFFAAIAWLLARLKLNITSKDGLLRKDALTGVHSLRAFMEEAPRLLDFAARHGHTVALGYLDVDGFKALNDSRGHAEGDRALRRLGAELNLQIRASDIAARVGGDEFVVLLQHVDARGAEAFFRRLHDRLLSAMRERGWPVGVSIGVVVFKDPNLGLSEALERADALMYEAKKTRRNSVVCRRFEGVASVPEFDRSDTA